MTAAVGHPTLRLVRGRIGEFELGELPAGKWRTLEAAERARIFTAPAPRLDSMEAIRHVPRR